jgi:hypothetical protein
MRSSLDGFYETLTVEHFSGIEAIALDMWDPYIASVRGRARESDGKIVFDKLHVVQHLGDSGKGAAAGEPWRLLGTTAGQGDATIGRRTPSRLEPKDRKEFAELRKSELKTARA